MTLISKDLETLITQLVDINGGHMHGTINNAKKENFEVMFLMHYLFAIVKSGINKLKFLIRQLYGIKILLRTGKAMSYILVMLMSFILNPDMNKLSNIIIK